jgi:DNA mismatch repair protein MutS
MALIKEYFDLTNKYKEDYGENTILLMMVGSFFEVYGILNKSTGAISGSKIVDFGKICELNIVEKNVCIGKDNVVMAGFKDMMIEKYIKKIQDAGFTAVVYTQQQDPITKNISRSCAGIFSPGTYFPSETKTLTNNLTCIWVNLIENKFLMKGKYVIVGVANIDIYTGKTSIFQFKEVYINNPTTYDELERFISIYKPSEVIFISNLPEKHVDNVINFTNIQSKSIHKISLHEDILEMEMEKEKDKKKESIFVSQAKNCEKQIYQREILNKFYKIEDYNAFIQNFYDNDIATQAFCFLLDFVFQHNPYLVRKISEPVFENCSDRLILANHSLKQLNVIDDYNSNDYSGKYSSVLKMLNECLTPMGKRKFAYNFLNPTTNTSYLEQEYNIISHILLKYEDYSDTFKKYLIEIKDLAKWGRQMILKKITPKSFFSLYKNLESIKELFEFIKDDNILTKYLSIYETQVSSIGDFCKNINNFISKNINLELALEIDQTQNFELNFINLGVDAELDLKTQLITESEDKLQAIRTYLNNLIPEKSKGQKNNDLVKIHETEKNSYSLVCTSRRCKMLEDALPANPTIIKLSYKSSFSNSIKTFDFTVSKKSLEFAKQSATNNFIFDTQIDDICKTITNIKVEMKDIITSVFYKFVDKFEMFQGNMESIIGFTTFIDLVYTKAAIAKKYSYCRPTIVEADKSFIKAKGLRHSLIEHLQNNELYVANDISLGTNAIDGVLLYGTNAVGKTSFIKSIGISLIMAQSGLFVPCLEFVYKPYKYIFTRIIGNDNIFKGLSTFAVEMSELRTILRLADENSLILGDELCSGTENTSAISIFVAGIERLHRLKSSFIFATHLHEIVDYEEITSLKSVVLKHMAVVYDKEKDLLIYDRKLRDGPGNNMYGLEVCKSLSLPDDFLEAAYNIRMKYNPGTGSMLSLNTSHFNAKKLMSLCEKCGIKQGTEVHHLQFQNTANDDNIIINEDGASFHKNNLANLVTLCEDCHNLTHKSNKPEKKVKTNKGYKILPLGKVEPK